VLCFEEGAFYYKNTSVLSGELNGLARDAFFSKIENHPSLIEINFSNTKFYTQKKETIFQIGKVLMTCKKLQSVVFRRNYLSYLSEKKLENCLKLLVQLPHLTSIDLRDNGFKVEQKRQIEGLLPSKITLIS